MVPAEPCQDDRESSKSNGRAGLAGGLTARLPALNLQETGGLTARLPGPVLHVSTDDLVRVNPTQFDFANRPLSPISCA